MAKISRPRFTVRRLMVAVVVVALSIEAFRLGQLSWRYWEKAKNCADNVKVYAEMPYKVTFSRNATQADREEVFDGHRRLKEHYERLEQKYIRAALRPWLTVKPDPPQPQ
jgi:hypothetical protein